MPSPLPVSPLRRLPLWRLAGALGLAACTTTTQDNFSNPPPGPPATCTATSALPGCAAGALSFACTSDRPDDGDGNLVCDQGSPGAGGQTLYCCAPYGQWATACLPSPTVPGCGTESLGFACTGATSPDEADPSLTCSGALPGAGGSHEYCCVTASTTSGGCRCSSFDDDAGTCGVRPSGCAGASIGLTCAPGHTPDEVSPSLFCDAADGGAPGAYCCRTP